MFFALNRFHGIDTKDFGVLLHEELYHPFIHSPSIRTWPSCVGPHIIFHGTASSEMIEKMKLRLKYLKWKLRLKYL